MFKAICVITHYCMLFQLIFLSYEPSEIFHHVHDFQINFDQIHFDGKIILK